MITIITTIVADIDGNVLPMTREYFNLRILCDISQFSF